MMAVEARRLGIHTIALDPSANPPARGIADETLQGSLKDPAALRRLAGLSDIMTYEIEHINTAALLELEAQGCRIQPRPEVLGIIQDKLVQKQFLASRCLPVPAFFPLSAAELKTWQPARYPFIQKARAGGYDGRGVELIRDPAGLSRLIQADSMIEDYVDLDKELAVLLARGRDGAVAVYDVVEMLFDDRAQICDMVCAPARIAPDLARRAVELGTAAIAALDGVGIFAVELFLDTKGQLLINEIAPRPHNSGHWTIEGAVCNQFEQHLRAVCGLPLGDPGLLRPAVMVNLLGAPDARGRPVVRGIEAALAVPGFRLHWYQKDSVAPFRKMGHWTVTAPTLDEALHKASLLKEMLVVAGDGTA